MAQLFLRDWKSILDIIYRVETLRNLEEFQQTTLECVRISIPFHQGLFYIYLKDPCNPGEILVKEPACVGVKPQYLEEFSKRFSKDPFFSRTLIISKDEVSRDSDILPDELRVQTDWYQEIYSKQGIHYGLRCQLTHDERLIGSLDLFRTKEERDFTDREVAFLETLSRHIALKLRMILDESLAAIPGDNASTLSKISERFGLTSRECDVVHEIFSGNDDGQITENLCITKSTLKKHIHSIYKKTGSKNRAQFLSIMYGID